MYSSPNFLEVGLFKLKFSWKDASGAAASAIFRFFEIMYNQTHFRYKIWTFFWTPTVQYMSKTFFVLWFFRVVRINFNNGHIVCDSVYCSEET
jgi:hypothetical protein